METNKNQSFKQKLQNLTEELLKDFIDSDYVQTFLMFGEKSEENIAIVHRMYKSICDMTPHQLITQTLIESTDSEEDKTLCRMALNEFIQKWQLFTEYLDKEFGLPDKEFMDQPINEFSKEYGKHVEDCDSVIKFTLLFLAGYEKLTHVNQYLVNNPKYIENPFAKLLTFQMCGFDEMKVFLEDSIDRRAEKFSEEEREELIRFFAKTMTFEKRFNLYTALN